MSPPSTENWELRTQTADLLFPLASGSLAPKATYKGDQRGNSPPKSHISYVAQQTLPLLPQHKSELAVAATCKAFCPNSCDFHPRPPQKKHSRLLPVLEDRGMPKRKE